MKNETLLRDCYAVLLPAFGEAGYATESDAFFRAGGVASLLGCSREEYVARRMSQARAERETAELFRDYGREARAAADAPVLITIDYEIGGVHRLHDLRPQLSDPSAALAMSDVQLEEFGALLVAQPRASASTSFSRRCSTSSANPWLANRCLAADPPAVGRITAAFVRGVQRY